VLSARRTITGLMAAVIILSGCTAQTPTPNPTPHPGFTMRIVVDGLANPWEVTWGPDGMLWVTEKAAGRVVRVSPTDGTVRPALTLPDVVATSGAQDGLLGLALHPSLLQGDTDQYVYLAYTYDPAQRKAKLVRYTYDREREQLEDPIELLTGMPAGLDHDSGRLVYGPDDKLYYTIGDQGHNQFDNYCLSIEAQTLPTAEQVQAANWSAYVGKVLRLNLDGSVPADNPVLQGVRSHIFSYGHRNAQGLVFGEGRLYSSEQGPKSDDEVNLIVAGGNYGWPRVAGYRDDKSYVYGDWAASQGVPCTSLRYSDFEIPASVPQSRESEFTDPAFVEPLRTFQTVEEGYDFRDRDCGRNYYICWPTVAPSSLDYYPAGGAMPSWGASLLMTSLKDGTVYRLPLGADGSTVGEPEALWRTVNRYRDIAIGPDTTTFYVATDPLGLARDLDGRPTEALAHRGAILEFRSASG